MKFKKILLTFLGTLLAIPTLLTLTGCQSKARISPNKLCLQFNDFLEETDEDGSREKMIADWFTLESENKTVDYQSLKNINGTLTVGILDASVPFSFTGSKGYTGLVVDMITRFCEEYGYGVKFEGYNGVAPLIAALNTDYCDIAATSLTITEERKKNAIYLKHGEPMIFGENNEFGLVQDGFNLKVVKIGENGITEKDILVHDAHCEDNTLQLKLALMEGPDFPIALGVIRDVEAPTYNDAVEAQIAEVTEKKKYHNFQELLMTNETWEVK